MDRFTNHAFLGRSHGPAASAPSDGLAQGMVYTAVLQGEPSGGQVKVTIPALHLSETFEATIQPGSGGKAGETAVVVFDEQKIPHVIQGSWSVEDKDSIERGTSLPASPVDGQEYDYVADSTNGVIWRLRYRSASASTHKWEFVGGASLHQYTTGGEKAVTANTWTAVPGSPEIVLPLAGDYEVRGQATVIESAALYGTMSMGVGHNGTPTEDSAVEATTFPNAANARTNLTILTQMAGRAANDKLALYFEVNENETLKTSKMHLLVRPVRVG